MTSTPSRRATRGASGSGGSRSLANLLGKRNVTRVALLAAVVGVAVGAHAGDLVSSKASLPAEDPFTHVVFVREYLANGFFTNSWHSPGNVYPPGLAAAHGAFVASTGASSYDVARWAPLLLGVLSIAAVFLLLDRHAGLVAAAVGGILLATAPEHVLRRSFFTPTVLDLVLVPTILFAMIGAARGERAWYAVLGLSSLAIAVAHPWALILVNAGAIAFLGARLILGASRHRNVADAAGIAGILTVAGAFTAIFLRHRGGVPTTFDLNHAAVLLAVALLGMTVIAMTTTWLSRAPRAGAAVRVLLFLAAVAIGAFAVRTLTAHVTPFPQNPTSRDIVRGAYFTTLALGGGFLAFLALAAARARLPTLPGPRVMSAAGVATLMASAAATMALFLWVKGITAAPLFQVNYEGMFRLPLLVAAFVGIAFLIPRRSDVGLAAAGLAGATVPFTLVELTDSWFIPHRTVIYVTVAAALLAGFAAREIHRIVAILADRLTRSRHPRQVVLASAVALLVATPVAAMPNLDHTYEWYYLFDETEFAALEIAADGQGGGAIVTTGWQSSLVVKSMAGDPWRVFQSPAYFLDEDARAKTQRDWTPVSYVIVDAHGIRKLEEDGWATTGPDSVLAFLDNDGYELVRHAEGVRVYRVT